MHKSENLYKLRNDVNVNFNKVKASEVIGLAQPTLSNILNGKVACKKTTAYCITKYISKDAEIEDFFVRIK